MSERASDRLDTLTYAFPCPVHGCTDAARPGLVVCDTHLRQASTDALCGLRRAWRTGNTAAIVAAVEALIVSCEDGDTKTAAATNPLGDPGQL